MPKATAAQKETRARMDRVSRAYQATCSGITINMMDISKVFDAGYKAIDAGVDDDGLKLAVRSFVETIRQS